jgi:hypothetical protein
LRRIAALRRPQTAVFAGPVAIAFGAWLAWRSVRVPWFMRLTREAIDLLGREEIPRDAVALVRVHRGELIVDHASGASSAPITTRYSPG